MIDSSVGLARRDAGTRRGLTLVEVIVVVGVAALGMVAAGPALQVARQQAREVTCEAVLLGLGTNLALYAADNEDYFPSVNTSGVALRAKQYALSVDPNALNNSTLPVQSWDWMSPLAAYDSSVTLEDNRAARWYTLWTTYRCPEKAPRSTVYAGGGVPDVSDFVAYRWPACSYLMPACFSLWGTSVEADLGVYELTPVPVPVMHVRTNWEVSNTSFFSRLDQVGPADRKIFVADGTRYLPDGDAPLDHDISPYPLLFGAFATQGAWWGATNAYHPGVGTDTYGNGPVTTVSGDSDGNNLRLSYRHQCANPRGTRGPRLVPDGE
ncbi:MAG: prepilin-type N-terminal cleavage/methylation domain-containing protein, partial [Phycisphaerae bacterium]|nr:prepilin-type N-terminal cleavage/methylation domain-containing protein [Phycisphaerae bacterium]